MEGVLIGIVEKGLLDTISVLNVDKMSESIRFMDPLTGRVIRNKSFIVPLPTVFKEPIDRRLADVCFEKALEH